MFSLLKYLSVDLIIVLTTVAQRPLLLILINFNPSMKKQLRQL